MARRRVHSAPEQKRFTGDEDTLRKQTPEGSTRAAAKSTSRSRTSVRQEVEQSPKGSPHRQSRVPAKDAQASRDPESSRERAPPETTTTLELECDDVFVQGGVELSPSRDHTPGYCVSFDRPGDVHPLSSLESRQLEDFWPPDTPKALFLDYDGTLREFEMRPELAVPTDELKALLRDIDKRSDVVPHIISGRDANFLETHFGHLNSFTLIAEHGYQVRRAGTDRWDLWDQGYGSHDEWKAQIRPQMERFVAQTPGSHLEEKASSLVWHYREVADQAIGASAASEAMDQLRQVKERDHINAIMISSGNKVVEVSFHKVRKGPVMRKICEDKALFGEPFSAVLCAGDDVSDESMFELAPSDFLTIKVGNGATLARFRAEGPARLRKFLSRLVC